MNNNTYTEIDVLRLIGDKNEGSNIEGDKLVIPDDQLTLRAKIVNCQEINGNYSAQVIFFLDHPIFDQTLVESCAGLGGTANEAIEKAAENFGVTVMLAVRSALKCDGDEYITTELMGEKHIFHVPCFSATAAMGGKFLEKADLWTLVKDVIPMYLGCKRVYWIKLFAAMAGGNITCEARINGIVCSGLTELMKQRLPLSGEKPPYGTYKAFLVLIQNEETFTPCPYTAEQVRELTTAAIEKFRAVHDQESHSRAINDIINSAPVESLGWEMAGLIPELYCIMVLRLNENDSIMYFRRESRDGETLRTTQLSSYDPIASAVYSYITQKHPSKEDNLSVLASSSLFKSVHKAILDGAKMEDLRCSDIMYSVCENYKIY